MWRILIEFFGWSIVLALILWVIIRALWMAVAGS